MAKKAKERKLRKENKRLQLQEIMMLQYRLEETDPTETYVDKIKTTDKNGNVVFKEGTVCPYSELKKQQKDAIDAYTELCKNDIDPIEVVKIVSSVGVNVGLFIVGMQFEKTGTFTFETFRNFLRKPKI